MIKKALVLASALAMLVSGTLFTASAQDEPTPAQRAAGAAETRQSVFKLLLFNLLPIAGMAQGAPFPSMMGAIQRLGLNQGRYLVLGDPTGYASSAAALINGTLAHSLDFDDTHAAASLHSSALYKEGRASKAEVLRLTKKEKSQNSRWMLWADLMKRVFQEDVSCCVRCGGRMELRAVVIRPPATLKVLAGLVRSERGRDPPGEVTGWGSE